MPEKSWKVAERRLAKLFQTQRNPLSGGNSKHTRSDSLHPVFYLENKHSARSSLRTLFDDTRAKAKTEAKIPVVATQTKNKPGILLTVHSDDLLAFCIEFLLDNDYQITSSVQEESDGQ